jgi:hypothetical protein
MTDEEVILIYTDMEECYGSLPSWEHEPMQFAYLMKMYLYRKERALKEVQWQQEVLMGEKVQPQDQ